MSLTVGADTYISLADAETYFAARPLSAAWTAATEAAKEAALKAACRGIERLPPQAWEGNLTDTTQALSWPRRYVIDKRRSANNEIVDSYVGYWTYYDEASYPALLTEAQCEEALAILELDAVASAVTAAQRDRQLGIQSRRTSEGAGVTYTGQSSRYGGSLYSAEAWHRVQQLRHVVPPVVKR